MRGLLFFVSKREQNLWLWVCPEPCQGRVATFEVFHWKSYPQLEKIINFFREEGKKKGKKGRCQNSEIRHLKSLTCKSFRETESLLLRATVHTCTKLVHQLRYGKPTLAGMCVRKCIQIGKWKLMSEPTARWSFRMTAKKWVTVSSVRTGVPGIAKRSTYRESVTGRGLTQNWFALSTSWRHLNTRLK